MAGDARGRDLFEFIPFLVFLEESPFLSVELYSEMVVVQLDDLNRALVIGDVLKVIVGQESFGDVVHRLHKGNNGKLLFSD